MLMMESCTKRLQEASTEAQKNMLAIVQMTTVGGGGGGGRSGGGDDGSSSSNNNNSAPPAPKHSRDELETMATNKRKLAADYSAKAIAATPDGDRQLKFQKTAESLKDLAAGYEDAVMDLDLNSES